MWNINTISILPVSNFLQFSVQATGNIRNLAQLWPVENTQEYVWWFSSCIDVFSSFFGGDFYIVCWFLTLWRAKATYRHGGFFLIFSIWKVIDFNAGIGHTFYFLPLTKHRVFLLVLLKSKLPPAWHIPHHPTFCISGLLWQAYLSIDDWT